MRDTGTYLGLGKTLFNSSACLVRAPEGLSAGLPKSIPDIELVLSERLLQKKATGAWPEAAIRLLDKTGVLSNAKIVENRDVNTPLAQETALNQTFPFFEYLKREGLDRFSQYYNPQIEFLTHHRCHAAAAMLMSPFEKCLIVVMDGAGSLAKDFLSGSLELKNQPSEISHEECSVYLHESGKLNPVFKRWSQFKKSSRYPEQTWNTGPGILYEKTAEFIFNSSQAAGKVMGLAPFGKKVHAITDRAKFLESLDWSRQFKGKSKAEWESCGRFEEFADLALSVQQDFELQFFELLKSMRAKHPEFENIILTGGCALNCTFNAKLLESGLFSEIYVPPFPGDESIALGAASEFYYRNPNNQWGRFSHEIQHGYFGPKSSVPSAHSALNEEQLLKIFAGYKIAEPESISAHVAELLAAGAIVGWFQGRSESGPRALGNRSILANPLSPGLKLRMNREIKLREDFRPYGASCLYERIFDYFEVPKNFSSPFMSFAVRPRAEYRDALREVSHVDGTSRVQSVREGQNPLFYDLIKKLGEKTGVFCVLNTSLNVMGHPIAETIKDVRGLLETTPLHGAAVGRFYIQRQPTSL